MKLKLFATTGINQPYWFPSQNYQMKHSCACAIALVAAHGLLRTTHNRHVAVGYEAAWGANVIKPGFARRGFRTFSEIYLFNAQPEDPNCRSSVKVSDGLQAVRRAEELQPDLIVLDIGLPSLNGIEAARRIQKLSPKSKILFVSQESSVDVVREALGTGASGYVVKTDAGRELLEGVRAALRDELFVGRDFLVMISSALPTNLVSNGSTRAQL